VGKVDKPYTAQILVMDEDKDKITLKIENLPPGLKDFSCDNRGKLSFCPITGEPRLSGNFLLKIFASDGRGGVDKKIIPLYIQPVR
jgi:hypothetical protein